eukprot:1139702-Pelagomonas_calceolata.AAC.1
MRDTESTWSSCQAPSNPLLTTADDLDLQSTDYEGEHLCPQLLDHLSCSLTVAHFVASLSHARHAVAGLQPTSGIAGKHEAWKGRPQKPAVAGCHRIAGLAAHSAALVAAALGFGRGSLSLPQGYPGMSLWRWEWCWQASHEH